MESLLTSVRAGFVVRLEQKPYAVDGGDRVRGSIGTGTIINTFKVCHAGERGGLSRNMGWSSFAVLFKMTVVEHACVLIDIN